ncbi:MAG: invasion associated locus B family protein [Shinella sp.]|uniref:invasion associated locus B family protein n=1 Tax=Shinella sp. TaxID=1870904 RepID=UPI003C753D8F
MTRRQVRIFGVSAVAAAAVVVGGAVYMAPGVAISTPRQAGSIAEGNNDPAPQHFEIAQGQAGKKKDGTATLLPGGASSLDETYTDWRVACRVVDNAKRCALTHAQAQQDGQRILAIELTLPSRDAVSGTLVLPFGLALDSGVTFQIDENPTIQSMRFRTCIPAGCLVSVAFDAATIAALRAGTALKVAAVADGGAAAVFSISLQGWGTALDRVAALSR